LQPLAFRFKTKLQARQRIMPKTSPSQRRTIGRVMHEAKHGELKSGPGGKGGKVKNRKQAIAIALNEAGASKKQSSSERRRSASRSRAKERSGRTGQQEREGRSHGARARKEGKLPAMRRKSPSRSGSRTESKGRTARSRAAAKAGRASGRARKRK
jgi:hypothetical protein